MASKSPQQQAPLLSFLTVACIAMTLARAVDSVLYYRISYILSRYLWFFSCVVYPIGYVTAISPIVCTRLYTRRVNASTLSTKWHHFFIMGVLDQSSNLLSTWPITTIGGASANILAQLVLPVNLVLAWLFLGTRCELLAVSSPLH